MITTPRLYRVRYCKGAVWSALKIWYGAPTDPVTGELLDRSPRWQCLFNGREWDDPQRFILHLEPDGTPVIKGEVIDRREYEHLISVAQWAEQVPTAVEAQPTQPIDHLSGDMIF